MKERHYLRRVIIFSMFFLAALLCTPRNQAEAATNPAKISSAKISGGKVVVKATVSKKISSSDKYYYLVKINGMTNKPANALAKKAKAKSLTFTLSTKDKAHVISKMGIAVKKGSAYTLVSNTKYVSNPGAIAANTSAYTLPSTKKGIHGYADTNLDCKHSLLSININDLIATKATGTRYKYNGKTYYFSNTMQSFIQNYNKTGVCVTVVLYMNWNEANQSLIHPAARQIGKGTYWYMLNTSTESAREKLEALFCYLGENYCSTDCYVNNWVMGNEVNSQRQYNHAGDLSFAEYVKGYTQAFKMLSDGIHTGWANARIFVPLDNAWNIPISTVGWNGKTFLTAFAKSLKSESSVTKWNLAYHAYSFPLTVAPYKYNQYVTKSADSCYITPQNLKYLTNYIKKTYGSSTRIILSEEGYMASMGETAQAASMLYSYYMAEFNPMVDAFIIRCERDDPGEVAQGYPMGLFSLDGKKREVYKVFKYMDSPSSGTYAKKYLTTVGAKSWAAAVPGYKASRFK